MLASGFASWFFFRICNPCFKMRPRISVWGSVRPSDRWSVGRRKEGVRGWGGGDEGEGRSMKVLSKSLKWRLLTRNSKLPFLAADSELWHSLPMYRQSFPRCFGHFHFSTWQPCLVTNSCNKPTDWHTDRDPVNGNHRVHNFFFLQKFMFISPLPIPKLLLSPAFSTQELQVNNLNLISLFLFQVFTYFFVGLKTIH